MYLYFYTTALVLVYKNIETIVHIEFGLCVQNVIIRPSLQMREKPNTFFF